MATRSRPKPSLPGDKAAGANSDESAQCVGSVRVVGAGASAGGLEAFTELVSAIPADTGLAFVPRRE